MQLIMLAGNQRIGLTSETALRRERQSEKRLCIAGLNARYDTPLILSPSLEARLRSCFSTMEKSPNGTRFRRPQQSSI